MPTDGRYPALLVTTGRASIPPPMVVPIIIKIAPRHVNQDAWGARVLFMKYTFLQDHFSVITQKIER
jgi:hypothetical protein